MFQFHIGTIISVSGDVSTADVIAVSIPHWYNYKFWRVNFARKIKAFQFHIGTIISNGN